MKNKEILKKAIEKAVKNNWEIVNQKVVDYEIDEFDNIFLFWNDMNIQFDIFEIIFSHDFAKAFWGEDVFEFETLAGIHGYISWQYHIQKLAVAEDKFKYLEKFI